MKAIMWVLFFCALLVIIGRLYLVFLSEKFSHKLRRKTQIKKLRQNLEKSSNNLKETNDVIYKYLETLTGKNLSQKTASELGDYLSTETRISKDKVDTLQKLVGKIEMSLYANSATQDSQKVAQEALDILSEMEKSL